MSHKIHYLNFPRGTPPILCRTKMHSFVWHMRSVVDRQTMALLAQSIEGGQRESPMTSTGASGEHLNIRAAPS
jgi:hypothetical protein